MEHLQSGAIYGGSDGWFHAGSRGDGLAMEDGWGHAPADRDVMYLKGGRLGVNVPQSHKPCKQASLLYRQVGCPPAMCKLEVADAQTLMKIPGVNSNCIESFEGRQWLSTSELLNGMKLNGENISGPAMQDGLTEIIFTLVGNSPDPSLEQNYRQTMRRNWPTKQMTDDLMYLPILVVLVGHKNSTDFPLQARISHSHCELKLMSELPVNIRQGYIACKYVLKRSLSLHRSKASPNEGRSTVRSYHLKTVFLHHLEQGGLPDLVSPYGLMLDLLGDLDKSLERGELPHYFLPHCNLLEMVPLEERCVARHAIWDILSDPLTALLSSPATSHDIYGDIQPYNIVAAFRRLRTRPTCEWDRKNLTSLLESLDKQRQHAYKRQLVNDWSEVLNEYKVTGRSQLIDLASKLEQIYQ